jgi:heme/copper-type cytochrome/quinol oxidase subunit 3
MVGMKSKLRATILGIYDLVLAAGAIYTGILMLRSDSGVFLTFPKEWLLKVPFDSWAAPGVIVIILFGLGNIAAAAFAFIKKKKEWMVSGVMGLTLLISLILQIAVLGETYLATVEGIIISVIQLALCFYNFTGTNLKSAESMRRNGGKYE